MIAKCCGLFFTEQFEKTHIAWREGNGGDKKELRYIDGVNIGEYYYYHQNEHGDIEYITGKDGKIENAYTYDEQGRVIC